MTLKNKHKNNVNKNAKHFSGLSNKNKRVQIFKWLSERGCKQRHLCMELFGKFHWEVI